MSVQGVMNTRLQEGIGLWEANAYVQGTAFALSLIVAWLFGSGQFSAIQNVPKGYWLGGVLGLGLSLVLMRVIGDYMNLTLVLSASVVQLAMGFSMGVGVIFGLYPANKASKLKPIDALHYS